MTCHTMRRRWERLRTFIRSTDGPTGVEYAILLALIVLVAAGAIQAAGGMMAVCFQNIASAVATSGF